MHVTATPQPSDPPPARRARFAAWLLRLLAALYAMGALWALLLVSPRVPYADEWRHLGHLLAKPADTAWLPWLAAPANGHRELLTMLARALELAMFHGQPWLQIALGALLWIGCALLLAWLLLRPRALAWPDAQDTPASALLARDSRMLAALLLLGWLAGIRTLAHGNEALHSYAVIACLLGGLLLLTTPGRAAGLPRLLLTGALGVLASFSFGTGAAVFAGFVLALWLQRARWREVLLMLAIAVLALWLYSLGFRPSRQLRFVPLEQLEWLLRWLAGPWRAAFWPLLEPGVAAQLPEPLRTPVASIATHWQATFGPLATARWPWLGIGGGGVALWLWQLHSTREARVLPRPGRIAGLALAAFALAVGVLVVAARHEYFAALPDQILAPRYFVWSGLFWGGLLLAWLVNARARRGAWVVALLAVLLLPSEIWMLRLGEQQHAVATQVATAVRVGVLPPTLPLGENNLVWIERTRPLLAARHDVMWHWPDAAWFGRVPPATNPVTVNRMQVAVVGNALGADGREVRFESRIAAPRLLLLDADGRVVGLAMPDRLRGGEAWIGWAIGTQGGVGVAMAPQ